MTTWKLTMTPQDGPVTEKTGLTREQTLTVLADLMYGGGFDEAAEPTLDAERREDHLPLAA